MLGRATSGQMCDRVEIAARVLVGLMYGDLSGPAGREGATLLVDVAGLAELVGLSPLSVRLGLWQLERRGLVRLPARRPRKKQRPQQQPPHTIEVDLLC